MLSWFFYEDWTLKFRKSTILTNIYELNYLSFGLENCSIILANENDGSIILN